MPNEAADSTKRRDHAGKSVRLLFMTRPAEQAADLPSAKDAPPFGRFAATALETPALRRRRVGSSTQRENINLWWYSISPIVR